MNFPEGKYDTIYVDPPWPMKKLQRSSRPNQKEMPYKTMSLEEIHALPVEELAEENATLWLWATSRFLPHALDIMDTWGFKYQRTIAWDKGNGMCLYGFHHRVEFLLFGYRGKLEPFPKRKAFPTLVQARSLRHSAKPQVVRELIEPFGQKRIELFARERASGWDSWGDELDKENET